jgi:hypothetical protein
VGDEEEVEGVGAAGCGGASEVVGCSSGGIAIIVARVRVERIRDTRGCGIFRCGVSHRLEVFIERFQCSQELTSDLVSGGTVAEDVDTELHMLEVGFYLCGRKLVELLLDDAVEDQGARYIGLEYHDPAVMHHSSFLAKVSKDAGGGFGGH